jgi:hypothetical protein
MTMILLVNLFSPSRMDRALRIEESQLWVVLEFGWPLLDKLAQSAGHVDGDHELEKRKVQYDLRQCVEIANN